MGALCFYFSFLFDVTMAQSVGVQTFLSSPYPNSMVESLQADGVNTADVSEVIAYSRTGKPDVHLAFLGDRFYLFFDLNGLKKVYLMDYYDSVETYASELAMDGIPSGQLEADELVNCLLKYYTRQ